MRQSSLLKTIICLLLVVHSPGVFASATSLCTGAIKGRTVSVAPIGFDTTSGSVRCSDGTFNTPCAGLEFSPLTGLSLNNTVVDPLRGVVGIIVNYRFTFKNITTITQTVDVGKSVINGAWGGTNWGGSGIAGGGTLGSPNLQNAGLCSKVKWSRGNFLAAQQPETGCIASLGSNESVLGSIDVLVCANGTAQFLAPGATLPQMLNICGATRARTVNAWTIFTMSVNVCADRGAITGALSLASDHIGGLAKEDKYPPSVTPMNGGRPF